MALALAVPVGIAGVAVPGAEAAPAAAVAAASGAVPSERARYPVPTKTVWLCRPGMPDNPCEDDVGLTVVQPDGRTRTGSYAPARSPRFDCFYVYPTVSRAPTTNAPKRVTPELVYVARAQAVPFQSVCRLYAPVYRQITSAGLAAGAFTDPAARALAQRDVVSAFHDYLNRFNQGRPFLLLGHSQGAIALTQLVQEEIDGNRDLRRRMVSAMLIGGGVWLAPGSRTRGTFQNVPPCRRPDQARCVVAYNTYAGPPPADGLFGRDVDGRRTVCVNPARPAGGSARLSPVVPRPSSAGAQDVVGYAEFVRSVDGRCRSNGSHTWLDVSEVPGSLLPEEVWQAGSSGSWGLHRLDVTLGLGDLVDLARRQARTVLRTS